MTNKGPDERDDDVVFGFTTAPDADVADRLARALVEGRLAACVNRISGATSYYRWEGALCVEPEVVLLVKSVRGKIGAIAAMLKEVHPYATCAWSAAAVAGGSVAYLDWVRAALRSEGP